MASSGNKNRFKKIADKLGRKVTDLLGEEDVYEEELLFALEDLNLCNGEEFLEATPEQLRVLKLSDEVIDGLREAQNRYRSFYHITGEKGVKPHSLKDDIDTDSDFRRSHPPISSQKPVQKVKKELPSDLFYDLQSGPGNGLIIINENFKYLTTRNAAANEEECLKNIACQLGVEINPKYICRDLTAEGMRKKIEDFTFGFKTHDSSFVFIAICSHGGEGDKICGINDPYQGHRSKNPQLEGDFLLVSKIEEILGGYTNLISKPKIFLIQSCRKGREKTDVEADGGPAEKHQDPDSISTCTSDLVIAFANGSDYMACDREDPIFLNELNEFLEIYKHEFNFPEILTICCRQFAEKHNRKDITCTFQSTLLRSLYSRRSNKQNI